MESTLLSQQLSSQLTACLKMSVPSVEHIVRLYGERDLTVSQLCATYDADFPSTTFHLMYRAGVWY